MSKHVVIVESSSKSKTIQKYLAQSKIAQGIGSFTVIASLGHIVDLPKNTLGIDTSTWQLDYIPIATKKSTISNLKKAVKDAQQVYLASDPDREGEAIAWHLSKVLKIKNIKRIVFHEITPKAIEEAITHPRGLDMALIEAQESRRALDRVVGYKVSPLLWRRFTIQSLSAGRVQSVALNEIVHRFKSYQDHVLEHMWSLEATFKLYETDIMGKLYQKKSKILHYFTDKPSVLDMMMELKNPTEWTFNYERKTAKVNPSAPYTTSSLQQEVYEKYGIPAKQTMSYAQNLYEKGYITYMRTDSVHLSDEAKVNIHEYLTDVFGSDHAIERSFKNKVANAQEAHECIRPSDITILRDDIKEEDFTSAHIKIYDLIWRKTVASQMPCAEYTEFHFKMTNKKPYMKLYEFRGKVSFLNVLGFLKIWQPLQTVQHSEIKQWDTLLESSSLPITFIKAYSEGDVSRPTPLYNEPSFIQWMEREGIGRPSTYSTVLEKLFAKGYISKGPSPIKTSVVEHISLENNEISTNEETLQIGGKDKDRYLPSSLGERVVEYLKEYMPNLLNKTFTATMEDNLDKISRNEASKQSILTEFYKEFEPSIQEANHDFKDVREKKTPSKKNIIKEFEKANLIQTRFGPALFVEDTQKFVGVASFLEWKQKNMDDLNDKDVAFLVAMPKVYQDIKVEIGRYGLYLSHNGKNYQLSKDLWEPVWDNTIEYEQLKACLVELPKKKAFSKKK